ncbi:MAG: hypothetical protein DSY47_02605 [Hydrogenothermus sp.]|nr:MAG: hypothetical protein DSY47_02605 [Hydrogenothermus sp.]
MVSREILARAINKVKSNLSHTSIRKAERIYRSNKVFNVEYPHSTAGVISALVEGDHSTYRVEFAYNNEMEIWEHRCTCPTRRKFCSHMLALLLYVSNDLSERNQVQDRLNDYLNSYSHDRCNLPIRGIMFGLEIEFSGNNSDYRACIDKFWLHNHRCIKELLNRGWKLKRDSSVDFELVSPISSKESLVKDFEDFPDLWEYWSVNTNGVDAGIHVHCSMDDIFAVGKQPLPETKEFLKSLAIYLEDKFIRDETSQIFGRDYTYYCKSWKIDGELRYKWINFLPLDRDVSKTIEIRIFSSSIANRIPEIIDKSYWLTQLFRKSLVQWRKDGRPSFSDWIEGRKLLEIIFSKSEILSFFKVFKPEVIKSV